MTFLIAETKDTGRPIRYNGEFVKNRVRENDGPLCQAPKAHNHTIHRSFV